MTDHIDIRRINCLCRNCSIPSKLCPRVLIIRDIAEHVFGNVVEAIIVAPSIGTKYEITKKRIRSE